MIRRTALRLLGCLPILGFAKTSESKTSKSGIMGTRITEHVLEVLKIPHEGSVAYVVITDSHWIEDGREKINRAWHVFDRKAFFTSLGGKRFRDMKATAKNEFPEHVQSFYGISETLREWHQFHMFLMQKF